MNRGLKLKWIALIASLGVVACSQVLVDNQEERVAELSLLYIGSSGYLIKTPHKKILLDGAFEEYVKRFEVEVPTPETRQQLAIGATPFDGVDLILVSHSHKGHFDAKLLLQVLQSNPQALLVTTQAAYQALKNQLTAPSPLLEQVYVPRIDVGESKFEEFQGIGLHVTKTDHWGGLKQLNFEFNVDGFNLVFALEAGSYQPKAEVDLQFITALEVESQAKHKLLTHQSGDQRKAALLEEVQGLEDVSFLLHSRESLSFVKADKKLYVRDGQHSAGHAFD